VTEDQLCFFRVSLQPGGRGLCAYAWGDGPTLLAIENWQMRGNCIEMSVGPIDVDPNGVTSISGFANGTILTPTVFGRGWHRQLLLRRESELERVAASLKNRMNETRDDETGGPVRTPEASISGAAAKKQIPISITGGAAKK
jgi:hypothetical protein